MPEEPVLSSWGPVVRHALRVTGPDAGTYLHSQVSNDVLSLQPGSSCQSFVLEPTGRIDALVRITRLADSEEGSPQFLLDIDGSDLGNLARRLERFKIRVRMAIEPVPIAVIALRADHGARSRVPATDRTHPTLGEVGAALVRAANVDEIDAIMVPALWGDGRALDVILFEVDIAAAEALAGRVVRELVPTMAPANSEAIDDFRVSSGWPAMESEISVGETIPAATGIVDCVVDFTKGCYPGQELVERMDSRGSSAPRSLRVISRDSRLELRAGDPVVIDGIDVGVVTSVGRDVLLAYVSRSADIGDVVGSS